MPIQAGSCKIAQSLAGLPRSAATAWLEQADQQAIAGVFQRLAAEGSLVIEQARTHPQAASFTDLISFARSAREKPATEALHGLAEAMNPTVQLMASDLGLTSRTAAAAIAAYYWSPLLEASGNQDLLRHEALALRHARPDPVYVDEAIHSWRGKLWAHMFSEDIVELHAFAKRLGAQRQWFQQPPAASWKHYDVSEGKRWQAVKLGAISTDRYTAVEVSLRIAGRLTPQKALSLARMREAHADKAALQPQGLLL